MFKRLNEKKWGLSHILYLFYLMFFCKDEEVKKVTLFLKLNKNIEELDEVLNNLSNQNYGDYELILIGKEPLVNIERKLEEFKQKFIFGIKYIEKKNIVENWDYVEGEYGIVINESSILNKNIILQYLKKNKKDENNKLKNRKDNIIKELEI